MSQFEFHEMLWIGGDVCGALLQWLNSALDYLMFLFYKPGLICRAKKQEIQSAQIILKS